MNQRDLDYVIEAHRHHAVKYSKAFRKWDWATPYYTHPIWCATTIVTETSLLDMIREDGIIVLLYHDVLEDTELTRDDLIRRGIPEHVVVAAEALTKQENLSYQENLLRVIENDLAREIKIADMLSNLADSPTRRQIKKYAQGLLLLLEKTPGGN